MRSKVNGPNAPHSSWNASGFRRINDSRAVREMASPMPLSAVGTHFHVNIKPNTTCNVNSLTNSLCVTVSFAWPIRNAPTTDSLSTSTTIYARRKVSGYRVQNWSRTWYNANISWLLMRRAS